MSFCMEIKEEKKRELDSELLNRKRKLEPCYCHSEAGINENAAVPFLLHLFCVFFS